MAYEDGVTNTVMPVAPMVGNGGGIGDFGGSWWGILFIIMLFMGFGNGGFMSGQNGGMGMYPWLNQSDRVSDGFANVQTALANGFGQVQMGLSNGFYQAEIAANARQMADMNQNFGFQTAMMQGFSGLQGQVAQVGCDNRLATANLEAVIRQENCADREALNYGVRDIIQSQNAGFQRILDQMNANVLEAKNDKILNLERELAQEKSQGYIQNAMTAQTQYLIDKLTPVATAAGG